MKLPEAMNVYVNTQSNLVTWLTLAVAALGLVVTVIYVILTYRLVRLNERSTKAALRAAQAAQEGAIAGLESAKESRVQRRISTEPLLAAEKADVSWYGDAPQSLSVRIKNYGDGPAFGVKARIALKDSFGDQLLPGGPVLSSGSAAVDFELARLSWRVSGPAETEISISCRDIYGLEHAWKQCCVLKGGEPVAEISTWPSASVADPELGAIGMNPL